MKEVVLITGIGKRLGYALACDLLNKGFGVIGTYRSVYPALDKLRDRGADLYHVDFYQQENVNQFISQITLAYPSLRAIIHNASDWLPDASKGDNKEHSHAEIMHKMMNIHVAIPYQLNLAFQQQLEHCEPGPADIVHISDYVAEKGSKKHIAYAASKSAMNNLTLSFASLLAPKVKVNSLSPALLKFNEWDDEAYKKKALAKALLPIEAGFEEVIDAIHLILKSNYMTGRNLQLDGGRHIRS
ncbi:dihydromonapterin reductase [Thalassotalea sp. M1531]|uniref:Dihydromonapterin reductase n=1 Tax=Thalassotalea algicola TaxID=2716224 RepID=A0A7Y0LDP4_9GAMM|nr:dihydromonapterin reductase [Thalassotalea algicola]NMP31741.1 dihydromonapterin reductase [Thalassotalea algicola]